MHRRALLTALGAGALLAACGPKPGGKAARPPLRVATYRGAGDRFLAEAGEGGAPYPITLSEFAGGNLITEAIGARAIDIGSMSEIPPVFIAGADPLVRLVAVLKGDVNNQVVLIPKGSAIRKTVDLKGKRVGYVRATTSQYLLLKVLEEQGLTFADIQAVALSPQDGRAAFERGSLDAWVAYGVLAQATRDSVGARVLTTGLGRLSGSYLYVASRDALADPERRSAVVDYLGRIRRTYAWLDAHPEDWARLLAKDTGLPAQLYQRQFAERSGPTQLAPVDETAIASLQSVADGFAKAGVAPAGIDTRRLWEPSISSQVFG